MQYFLFTGMVQLVKTVFLQHHTVKFSSLFSEMSKFQDLRTNSKYNILFVSCLYLSLQFILFFSQRYKSL